MLHHNFKFSKCLVETKMQNEFLRKILFFEILSEKRESANSNRKRALALVAIINLSTNKIPIWSHLAAAAAVFYPPKVLEKNCRNKKEKKR